MKTKTTIKNIAALAAFTWATASFGHIVLQDGVAAANASYRAVLRVGHGCDGSATTGIRVTLPSGFTGAQPMPKPGWAVSTRVGPLAEPTTSHGKTLTEGVLEITWTARSPADYLPDAFYDEFVLRGTTPSKPGSLWFKVVQTCEKGSKAWVDIPTTGTATKGLKTPAALLEVLDVQAAGEHQH